MTGVDDTELGAIDPPEQQHGPGLGERAAKGALITFSGQFARILLQVVSVVVLARLLTPHAYGVVAMVLAVIGIGEIFRDFGLSSAAIQSKTLSRGQRDNLFWVNAGIGLVLATIVFFAAPLIAIIYRHPEVEPLARALSLTFLMNGLATQYRADLNRRLKFMQLTTGDVLSPPSGSPPRSSAPRSGGARGRSSRNSSCSRRRSWSASSPSRAGSRGPTTAPRPCGPSSPSAVTSW